MTSEQTVAADEQPAANVFEKPTTFKDTEGHEWRVVFKASTFQQVKDATGVDFWDASNLTESGPLTRIGSSERLQIDVLWHICQAQAENESLTKNDFADRFAGPVFDSSFEAIQGGLLVFFSGAHASLFRRTLAHLTTLRAKQEKLVEELYEISNQQEAKLSKEAKERWASALLKEIPNQVIQAITKAINKNRPA